MTENTPPTNMTELLPVARDVAVKLTERDYRVFDLKVQGLSFREIGKRLDVPASTVRDAFWRVYHDAIGLPADAYRHMHTERLENMYMKLIAIGENEEHLPQERIGAYREARQVLDREAKLLGLDAPDRVDLRALIINTARSEGINVEQALRDGEMALDHLHAEQLPDE